MKIVTLQLFKGEKKFKEKEDGTLVLASEHQKYKVSYDTFDWDKFKKNAPFTFSEAKVLGFQEQKETIIEVEVLGKKTPKQKFDYVDLEVTDELKAEVKAIFKKASKVLTPDEKIAELEAKIEAMSNANNGSNPEPVKPESKEEVVEESDDTDTSDDELTKWRAKYKKVFGKKPHHMLGIEKMEAQIEEELNK